GGGHLRRELLAREPAREVDPGLKTHASCKLAHGLPLASVSADEELRIHLARGPDQDSDTLGGHDAPSEEDATLHCEATVLRCHRGEIRHEHAPMNVVRRQMAVDGTRVG